MESTGESLSTIVRHRVRFHVLLSTLFHYLHGRCLLRLVRLGKNRYGHHLARLCELDDESILVCIIQ